MNTHTIYYEGTATDCAGVGIVCDPLDNHEEHQPPKYAQQEQHLRNKLHKETDVALEVTAKGRGVVGGAGGWHGRVLHMVEG